MLTGAIMLRIFYVMYFWFRPKTHPTLFDLENQHA